MSASSTLIIDDSVDAVDVSTLPTSPRPHYLHSADHRQVFITGIPDTPHHDVPIQCDQPCIVFHSYGEQVGIGNLAMPDYVVAVEDARIAEAQGAVKKLMMLRGDGSPESRQCFGYAHMTWVCRLRQNANQPILGNGARSPASFYMVFQPLLAAQVTFVGGIKQGDQDVDVE